ncbi:MULTISPECIES: xylulokinase [unclassified Meiothermus]|uniref:xylulokinase n=1 Tax=unclassified Meiothermus TaxID=370471 RepID=UPI000D7C4CD4|nr:MULTISPECIES: xylulokinase [unclassified Meiothermus]PZA07125.1 xylulokinase [Meiothermus sp. Pnk-1]RYM39992.1 xylulokinase [Meiothermus sp. PNK-Is4]
MFLGLDLGTGSLKVLLLDEAGRVRGEASRAYPVRSPRPGWAESDPQAWWSAAGEAVRKAVPDPARVQAIGLSGQMHGVVLCQADGAPLRPAILWADGRSGAELELYRRLPAEFRRRLANPPAVGMAGPSLLWLRRHEPEVYRRARWALQPKDWLRLRLTGEARAEPSDASATLMYDLEADGWFHALLEELDLRQDWLAPLVPSASVAGCLTEEAAAHLGLSAGIPVAAGAADTAAALLGSGLAPGEAQLTVGSGAQIAVVLEEARIDPTLRTHLYRAAQPGRWYALAAMQNAGIALEWVLGVLGLDWATAYAEAQRVPPGCEGLTFLPYLTGERTPHLDPQARGAWAGLGLGHTRSHLVRAALEGLAFALRQGLEALGPAIPAATPLRLAGGGTLEPFWRQMLSDVLGRPLWASSVAAASARGAALLAAMATGPYPDWPAEPLVPVAEPQPSPYEAAYVRFEELYPRLKGWG